MKLIILAAILTVGLAGPELSSYDQHYSIPGEFRALGEIDKRIINGQFARPHSIPYQAFLRVFEGQTELRCGGSLITPNAVVTAAHCVHRATMVTVVLGAQNLQEYEPSRVGIDCYNIIVHEEFAFDVGENDIALLIFPFAIQLNEYINTVQLPPRGSHYSYAGEIARLSGWGRYDGNQPGFAETLLVIENPILSNSQCRAVFPKLNENQVCLSGYGGRSSCQGDSGGPLTVNNVLIGISSYTYDVRCLAEYGAVFTRVSSYTDWIARHLQNY